MLLLVGNNADTKKERTTMEATTYDYVSAIIEYETGQLDDDETIELFQHLVWTGMAWRLQGHYRRMAIALIEEGYVTERQQNA
jgi:hypothetical protein